MGRTLAIALALLCLAACQSGPKFVTVDATPEEPAPANRMAAPAEAAVTAAAPETGPPEVRWQVLRGLNVKTSEATPAVNALDGRKIKLRGYPVPFEDSYESVTEFLLVPAAGMCVHTPPPPANQMVMVRSAAGQSFRVKLSQSIEVTGQLEIESDTSPYGQVSYRLHADSVRIEEL